MKHVKFGKLVVGEHLQHVISRLEFVDVETTIIDLKLFLLNKIKYIFRDDSPCLNSNDELNTHLIL